MTFQNILVTHFAWINHCFSMQLLPIMVLQFKITLDETKYLKLQLIANCFLLVLNAL